MCVFFLCATEGKCKSQKYVNTSERKSTEKKLIEYLTYVLPLLYFHVQYALINAWFYLSNLPNFTYLHNFTYSYISVFSDPKNVKLSMNKKTNHTFFTAQQCLCDYSFIKIVLSDSFTGLHVFSKIKIIIIMKNKKKSSTVYPLRPSWFLNHSSWHH